MNYENLNSIKKKEQFLNMYAIILRSCIAFSGKNRILGVAAKNQMVTNMKNTIYNFKRLLGRKYNDPQVQYERQTLPFKMSQQTDGSIGIHVSVVLSRKEDVFVNYSYTIYVRKF